MVLYISNIFENSKNQNLSKFVINGKGGGSEHDL